MAFIIDRQTLDDLNIFGKRGKNSVYGMFNTTRTSGGARVLEEMFLYPLSDEEKINKRSGIIRYFQQKNIVFPFRGELFDTVEYYLSNTDPRTRLSGEDNTLHRKLKGALGADTDYEQLHKGVLAGIEIIGSLRSFVEKAWREAGDNPYREELERIRVLAREPDFDILQAEYGQKKLPYEKTAKLDALLRFSLRDHFLPLLNWVYHLDVYISVARVATERGFVFARALPPGGDVLRVTGMYHPGIPNAVANSLTVDRSSNVIFLTGANMAGKSTFMKTLGTTVFLGHMGFPVPATEMSFSVLEGMYTTINLPDNLSMGYSHFYAEVLRVKHVASQLSKSKNLLVIFDELFRGTNVKDAYDATVAIARAFARKRECLFVISTHIVEAGEKLRGICDNVNFVYFPTIMEGSMPKYTYTLTPGITSDRHGMVIIRNEKILDILHDHREVSRGAENKKFVIDRQTLEDLNILGEYRANSVFSLFNRVRTRGGKRLLESMFQHPLTDVGAINDRAAIFAFFGRSGLEYPVSDELFQQVDQYFTTTIQGNFASALFSAGRRKFLNYIGADKEHVIIREGVCACVEFLRRVQVFTGKLAAGNVPAVYKPILSRLQEVFADKRLACVCSGEKFEQVPWYRLARVDYLLRHEFQEKLQGVLEAFYGFDVYVAVSAVARERGFTYAKALPFTIGKNHITIREFCHPAIECAVRNTIRLDCDRNVLFLTGANMAGKSTLMKSFSIAIYLAHMGFPVAADGMEFSVQDGLYTSINVADNINMGYSHYYAEVLRVKQVAEEVAKGKNLVVVFDELFKGTNVKDAYDATVSVTEAFSVNRNCTFIISTHIIEAGHALRERLDNLHFVFVPTLMKGNIPTYPYRLEEGITDDRHGMLIINNERILEMLE